MVIRLDSGGGLVDCGVGAIHFQCFLEGGLKVFQQFLAGGALRVQPPGTSLTQPIHHGPRC